ncbi:MAG: glutamate 5-kinase [Eubacteriales bacterium]|nr:glutamate 5-kinase [Eubacteriales bacterium]
MLNLSQSRRIVVKVGTSTLTYPNGKLNIRCIERLVRCIADLENRGYEMVLVSSGAIGVGASKLRLPERPKTTRMKQAAAAVGQCELMHIYDKMFLEYGLNVAQILLTTEETSIETRRINIHNTMEALIETGTVPIVNENDSVAIEEIEFGDNDTLSASVARLCDADLLVIFTDMDGLFDDDPRANPEARLIPVVHEITEELTAIAGGAGTENGTGGMATKLHAAQLCMEQQIPMFVINGSKPETLYDITEGRLAGTLFLPTKKEE